MVLPTPAMSISRFSSAGLLSPAVVRQLVTKIFRERSSGKSCQVFGQMGYEKLFQLFRFHTLGSHFANTGILTSSTALAKVSKFNRPGGLGL